MTIYKIHNTENDKVYIGGTTQYIKQRYAQHRWKLRNQVHENKELQSDWNQYGEEAFQFQKILSNIRDKERLAEIEKELAAFHNVKEEGYFGKDVYQYDTMKKDSIAVKNTVSGKKYASVAKASVDVGMCRPTISKLCKDSTNTEWVFLNANQ